MDIIKSGRFWLALVVIGIIGAGFMLGKISGDVAVAALGGILSGFGIGQAGKAGGAALKALLPLVLAGGLLAGCATTTQQRVDWAKLIGEALCRGQAIACKYATGTEIKTVCAVASDVCEAYPYVLARVGVSERAQAAASQPSP